MSCNIYAEKIIYIITGWGSSVDLNEGLFKVMPYYKQIRDELEKEGFVLKTPSSYEQDLSDAVFIVIYNDHYNQFNLAQYPKEKLILGVWEPPVICPVLYTSEYLEQFGRVFTWNDEWVDRGNYFKFHHPVLINKIYFNMPFDERKLCVFVGSNYVSNQPNELYSERLRTIEFFEALDTDDFDFYGRRWEPTLYKNYKGEILGGGMNKFECIKNYKFYLCYENTTNVRGYISEKIFHCFAAGCIPIYWGSTNITDYIPENCFIDRRKFSTNEELYNFIKNITEAEFADYINNIKSFLSSEQAQLFSAQNFVHSFVDMILAKK